MGRLDPFRIGRLKKNKVRKTPYQKTKENAFSSKLDNFFLYRSRRCLSIKITEDRDSWLAQQKDGKQGLMIYVHINLMQKEMINDKKKNLVKR